MGINREKERGSSTNEQKGSHWPEREGRNRGEDGGRREKKRARRESDRECSKRREKPNERGDRTKISQPRAGTAMALFKNLRERGEEVKKVKVCATLRAVPPSFSPSSAAPRPSLFPSMFGVSFSFFLSAPSRLLDIRLIFSVSLS